ncbi:MAG TPA: carboxypeptidase-like regulatory domain-containing protein [Flavobacteriales bacterium]|nr:carboxypeptidase-like regulatory domain-containing protein [Flavobacteriales bacterium]HRE97482.1 carboxypeptidase-like regulatory domain-containing protein [Flavobacteriales bacterium]HRJ37412.1 carboxypeptidase-like regulatory domain-containing protein [Flavobacteriales bacterium]
MFQRLVILAVVVLGTLFSVGATELRISGRVIQKPENKGLAGVKITLLDADNKMLQEMMSADSGKFKLEPLVLNKVYQLRFEKRDFLSRFIEIDLSDIPISKVYEDGWEMPIEMGLIKMEKGKDYSPLVNLSSGKLMYVEELEDLDYDMVITEHYKKKELEIAESLIPEPDPELGQIQERTSNFTLEYIFGGILVVALLLLRFVYSPGKRNK